jgi:hypothetical protein
MFVLHGQGENGVEQATSACIMRSNNVLDHSQGPKPAAIPSGMRNPRTRPRLAVIYQQGPCTNAVLTLP